MPGRIAVLDATRPIADLFAELFTEEGYEVVVWPDTMPEPLDLVSRAPDLIILDHFQSCHGVSPGLRLLQALKQEPATAAIPVIVCSAATVDVQMAAAYPQAHHVGVVEKPFRLEVVLAAVATVLGAPGTPA